MLRGLRLDGVDYGRCEMAEPWGILFPAQTAARFHFIGRQRMLAAARRRQEWVELNPGDAVLLPRGAEHVLASAPGVPALPLTATRSKRSARTSSTSSGDGGKDCDRERCCSAAACISTSTACIPLLGMMPDVMRAHELEANEPGIPHLLEAWRAKSTMERVGSGGILARLADVLAASIIRSWVERGCGDCDRLDRRGQGPRDRPRAGGDPSRTRAATGRWRRWPG